MEQTLKKLKNRYTSISEPAKASLWYVICNILNKGISLLATPIFTRIMSQEQFGVFVNFQSWYNILIICTSLNIFLGSYQKGLITWKNDVDRFTSSCLSLIVTITSAFGLIYLCDPLFFSSLLDLPPILMLPMFLELLFMPALELWANKQRFYFKYKKFVMLSIGMNAACMIFGITAVMLLPWKAEARVYTDVLGKLMFVVPLFIMIFWKGRTFFNKTWWKYSMNFNIPLIPHYLSNYVLNQSDRIMITKMVSASAAAMYYVAYQISMMMSLVTNAINSSLTPVIYHNLEKENIQAIDSACKPLVWLIGLLSVCAMLFAPEIVMIFAEKNYGPAIYVIPPVAASVYFVFLYNLFSNVEYYYEKTKLITAATVTAALLNLLLNWIFIPIFNFYAAGYTTLVSYMLLAWLHYRFYIKVMHECLPGVSAVFDIRNIVVCSVVVVICTIVIAMIYPYPLIRYSLIALLAVTALIKRRELIRLVRSIMPKKAGA